MENGAPAAYAYNALGERVSMYDDTGDTIYEYDSLGRIISVTTYRTPDGADMPESSTGADGEICAVAGGTGFSHAREAGDRVSYAYDDAGNLSAITYPDGTQVLYGYDLNGNLVKVTDREGRKPPMCMTPSTALRKSTDPTVSQPTTHMMRATG